MNRWTGAGTTEIIRVMIVAPDPLARASLEQALSTMEGLHIAGVASLDDDLQSAVEAFQPEVVVAEVDWDSAPSALEQQRLSELEIPMLLLAEVALDPGSLGQGWLRRSSQPAQIQAALQAIVHDLVVFDRQLVDLDRRDPVDQPEILVDPLTPRELDVLQRMAEDLTNRAIAFELGISEYTVKFHVNSILTKLNAQSRTEACVKAARMGLILL